MEVIAGDLTYVGHFLGVVLGKVLRKTRHANKFSLFFSFKVTLFSGTIFLGRKHTYEFIQIGQKMTNSKASYVACEKDLDELSFALLQKNLHNYL